VSGIAEVLVSSDLLSVIGVGNETGIFQHELTSHILGAQKPPRKPRMRIHVDFVAGWGKADLDLSSADAPDLVAIAGHKLGGLSGAGALLHRKSIPVGRGGTPNLAGIVALKALAEHWGEIRREQDALRALRDGFERDLRARFPEVVVAGADLPRVPNVSNFVIPGRERDLSLVAQLDLKGFAVSAGSACASGAPEPSHVLLAMGVPAVDAKNALRISLHPGNTAAELAAFLDALDGILKRSSAR
jgi:cysteine desulfurase